MRSLALLSALAALSAVQANPTKTEKELPRRAASLPTVTVSGNAFFAGSNRFYVRGIDYQPGGSSGEIDPLADTAICNRDIAKFKKLGVNTIRIYMVDNSKNHDDCMNALADAGIYLVLDVNNPKYSINRENPEPSYNAQYLQSVFATMDGFAKYTNMLAFFSGNEVIDANTSTTLAAKYVKAVTRDMKNYLVQRGYRKIPVGYSAADVSQNRLQTAHYMNCGDDAMARGDFFAFNDYSWCKTSFTVSGWDQKVKNFTGYGIPIFLSEWGCITNGRDFMEVQALMSSQMTGVYSGGLLYEYSQEGNGYGIVTLNGNSVTEGPDFSKFASALSTNVAPTGNGGFSAQGNVMPCPPKDPDWLVEDGALPAFPDNAKQYLSSGAGLGPGLKGPGSQNSGPSAPAPDGTSTGGGSSSSPNAAVAQKGPIDKSPFLVTGLALLFSFFGVLLL